MNYDELKDLVEGVNGSTFAGVDTLTNVKLTGGKKNPLQGRVQKRTTGANTMIFSNIDGSAYENMVKRRLTEEGKDAESFELKERKWGSRVGKTPFIEHNGKHYLELFYVRSGESVYLVDGVETPEDEIEGLPVKKVYADSQGGLENKVQVRTVSIDSIESIRMKGQELK